MAKETKSKRACTHSCIIGMSGWRPLQLKDEWDAKAQDTHFRLKIWLILMLLRSDVMMAKIPPRATNVDKTRQRSRATPRAVELATVAAVDSEEDPG